MNEGQTRHSTRVKKPSKFKIMLENDYSTFTEPKSYENKDITPNPHDHNQLAKLLAKFINSANHKVKDLLQDSPSHHPSFQQQLNNGNGITDESRQRELPPVKSPSEGSFPRKMKDSLQMQTCKGNDRSQVKKGDQSKKKTFPSSIEKDLSYHAMIGKHVKSTLPDSLNLSPELLMKIGLPAKETLDPVRQKETKRKKRGEVKLESGGSEAKPFKRQSYHIAIAYHIYLKAVREGSNPSERDIDPTSKARRLRYQQSQKQP